MLLQRVQEAQRIAIRELKDQDFDGKAVDSAAALEAEVNQQLLLLPLVVDIFARRMRWALASSKGTNRKTEAVAAAG